MARQNRVNPAGELIAHPSKSSTLMGNRGCLHDDQGRIVRTSARPAWVSCLLEFKGRQREIMKPGHYTELFFLDEPTALAAGHRPCSTCRRAAAQEFAMHWRHACGAPGPVQAEQIDQQMRVERMASTRALVDSVAALPDGTAVLHNPTATFYVLRAGTALHWSFDGYSAPIDVGSLPRGLTVLTPPTVLRVLSNGYRPLFHFSAS